MRIIFFRVAWMKKYQGLDDDLPINGGKWVNKNEDAGEAHNFTKCNGKYFGYVRPKTINIRRIGKTNSDSLPNVLIIFFATAPKTGGQFIVGWYKAATVFKIRHLIDHYKREGYSYYNAESKSAHLLKPEERWYCLPVKPGENNVWYGTEYMDDKQIQDIIAYTNNPHLYKTRKLQEAGQPKRYKFQNFGPRQPDIIKRKAIEKAAMDATWNYFKLQDFELDDVSDRRCGWDLQAFRNKTVLKIEVKGLSGNDLIVELTPNEYFHFLKKEKNYCLAILTNALTKRKKLHIFQYYKKEECWMDLEYNILKIMPLEFARICLDK